MKVMVLGNAIPRQLAEVARKDNVTTVRAADLSEALASLEKSHFDIVVLSGLNGQTESACSQIKKASRIPVVAMVNPEQAEWNEISLLPADGFISETTGQETLLARLRTIVLRSRAAKKAGLSSLSLRDLVLPGRSNPSPAATGNVGRLPLRKRGIKGDLMAAVQGGASSRADWIIGNPPLSPFRKGGRSHAALPVRPEPVEGHSDKSSMLRTEVASPAAAAPSGLNSNRVAARVRPQFSINWNPLAVKKTLMRVMYGVLAAAIGLLLFIEVAPGYDLLLVKSQSMEPTIRMGDMIITGPVNGPINGALTPGKIITFKTSKGLVTHRMVDIKPESQAVITKGDAMNHRDPDSVLFANIKGVYLFKIPFVGYIQSFVHSKMGWFIAIIIPSMALVGLIIKDILKEAFNEKKQPIG